MYTYTITLRGCTEKCAWHSVFYTVDSVNISRINLSHDYILILKLPIYSSWCSWQIFHSKTLCMWAVADAKSNICVLCSNRWGQRGGVLCKLVAPALARRRRVHRGPLQRNTEVLVFQCVTANLESDLQWSHCASSKGRNVGHGPICLLYIMVCRCCCCSIWRLYFVCTQPACKNTRASDQTLNFFHRD